jgi:hypothetical protein
MHASVRIEDRTAEAAALDGMAHVLLFGRAAMPSDVALLGGGTFARRIADQIDQTGVRLLEARLLESALP